MFSSVRVPSAWCRLVFACPIKCSRMPGYMFSGRLDDAPGDFTLLLAVTIAQRLAYQTVTRSLIRPRPPGLRSAYELLASSHSVNPNGLNWSMPSRWSVAKLQLSNRDWCYTVLYCIRASKRGRSVVVRMLWSDKKTVRPSVRSTEHVIVQLLLSIEIHLAHVTKRSLLHGSPSVSSVVKRFT